MQLFYIILKCQHINIDIYTRMKKHLNDIKNFSPFVSDKKCMPFHFSLKGHDVARDFAFYIINANIEDLDKRLAYLCYFETVFKQKIKSLIKYIQ